MREAIGGSLLLYLILPIIFFFIVLIAFIMNYASAYRAANYAITEIENCQGQVGDCRGVDLTTITKEIRSKYNYITGNNDNDNIDACYFSNGKGYVFRVQLPVSFELPLFGGMNAAMVKAETKTILNVPTSALRQFRKC